MDQPQAKKAEARTPAPASPEELFEALDRLGIAYEAHRHAPVFTVEEAQAVRGIPGAHTKNLFVKDKKDNYFLLVLEESAEIDLKTVHQLIGARSRVSFGSAERLMQHLGVTPGSVTALAVINDRDGAIRVVLDEALMDNDVICAHPLSNDATVAVAKADFLRFLEAHGHPPAILKLSR